MPLILAIDQGTTSTRAILFGADTVGRGRGPAGVPAAFPGLRLGRARARGPLVDDARDLPGRARAGRRRRAGTSPRIGITNQRETTLVWDRDTGQADRTAPSSGRTGARRTLCARLKADGPRGRWSPARTGLLLDPYFSGTKLAWLLDNVPGARARAERGELAFGTVDSWLLWRLTGGRRARHRRHQRLAHAALRHPPRRLGRRAARRSSACRARCCRRCATARPTSATTDAGPVRRRRSRSAASPATSRRRRSARPASRPAW